MNSSEVLKGFSRKLFEGFFSETFSANNRFQMATSKTKSDAMLLKYVEENPGDDWTLVGRAVGMKPKTAKARWKTLVQRPIILPWSAEEDRLIIALYEALGQHWSQIGHILGTGRDTIAVRDRWKKLMKQRDREWGKYVAEEEEEEEEKSEPEAKQEEEEELFSPIPVNPEDPLEDLDWRGFVFPPLSSESDE
jgi:hypothetical protein